MRQALLIFVKNPVLGTTKTRLAADIGDEAALEVYHQLLAYTKSVASGLDVNKQVWYSSFIENDDIWSDEEFWERLQTGNDLGERMLNAFKEAFKNTEAVVIIGSDCAELEQYHIETAFEKLVNTDVVIGPANDGGYYLLGMRRSIPELFQSMAWSTATVAADTIAKIKELGLSYQKLETLNDVDTIEDWKLVKHRLKAL